MSVFFTRRGEANSLIRASDLAIGESVFLMENGMIAEYLVVNHGIPSSLYDDSCNGTWLMRKDIYGKRQWHTVNNNTYANSYIHTHLNNDFLNLLGSVEQSAIKQVKIPYVNGTGSSGSVASGTNGLSTKVFLLGGCEVGLSDVSNLPADGSTLSYFANCATSGADSKRIAYFNGKSTAWWTRSPRIANGAYPWSVYTTGKEYNRYSCSTSYGMRPTFVLSNTALFDTKTLTLKGVK